MEGLDEWKTRSTHVNKKLLNSINEDFDEELLRTRVTQLEHAEEIKDDAAASFLLRTSLRRDFGGMDDSRLYNHCRIGTKNVIEEFIDLIISSLFRLSSKIPSVETVRIDPDIVKMEMTLRIYMDFFKELRHSLGNTALLLSGGGSLGIYHVGVLKALFHQKMLPRIICGASSGSIMASICCCRTDDEWPHLFALQEIDTHLLEELSPGDESLGYFFGIFRTLFIKARRLLSHGVVFDATVIRKSMQKNIGNITFLEAYQKTSRVLNIAVSSTSIHDMPCLLNYITSPNVLIWSAVVASCAVPALYESAPLLAKDHNGNIVPWNATGDRWIDGSVDNDLPMRRLSELFNVNHFIVSQVNPHIFPILRHAIEPKRSFLPRIAVGLMTKLLQLLRSEILYRTDQISSFGILNVRFCQIIKSVLKQKYHGDITIIPQIQWADIWHMFVDRPMSTMLNAVNLGEVATWPKMTAIQMSLLPELALDDILLKIRDRLLILKARSSEVISSTDSLLQQGRSSDLIISKRRMYPGDSSYDLGIFKTSKLNQADDFQTDENENIHFLDLETDENASCSEMMDLIQDTDVMLDNTVHLSRHVSPVISYRSASSFGITNSLALTENEVGSNAPKMKRTKSYAAIESINEETET